MSDKELFGSIDWGGAAPLPPGAEESTTAPTETVVQAEPMVAGWTPSEEKAVLDWPQIEDRIVEDLS